MAMDTVVCQTVVEELADAHNQTIIVKTIVVWKIHVAIVDIVIAIHSKSGNSHLITAIQDVLAQKPVL
jgi:hypothetical protein